jgi:acetyltransferase-like isoleucine patch superfamily enzyme
MSFGKYTYGIDNVNIYYMSNCGRAKLIGGNFCSLAPNINIWLGGNHNSKWVTTYPFGAVNYDTFNSFNTLEHGHPFTKGDVIIGNDVWISQNVTIMSGVTIGDGAIIANNSHIIKNVEPYSIVGGNPGKIIKYRFTQEQIKKLLEIKWWFWDDEKINMFLPLLCSENIDDFIKLVYNEKQQA